MIAFLTGRVAGKTPTHALIEVHGVGYQLAMSSSSLAALPPDGDDVTVQTFLYVREDEISLFGFESLAEERAFELLITVSGVGPKVALAALSTLSPDDLAAAVTSEDVAMISSVPGIGAKTAQRIILDLKDKIGRGLAGAPATRGAGAATASAEATDALLGMGFSATEAAASIKGYDGAENNPQALLRYALQRLGSGR
jgi:Holliday junction DNA helicase RuvA